MIVISTWDFALVMFCIWAVGAISGLSFYRPQHKRQRKHTGNGSVARKPRNRDYVPVHSSRTARPVAPLPAGRAVPHPEDDT